MAYKKLWNNEKERQEMREGLEQALSVFKNVDRLVKEKFFFLSKEEQYELTKQTFNNIMGV